MQHQDVIFGAPGFDMAAPGVILPHQSGERRKSRKGGEWWKWRIGNAGSAGSVRSGGSAGGGSAGERQTNRDRGQGSSKSLSNFVTSGGVRLPDHEVHFAPRRSSRRTRSYNVPRQGGRRSVRQGSLQVDFEVIFEVTSKKDERIIKYFWLRLF